MGLVYALNEKPVKTLGFLTAFHSIVYGIGYLTNVGGFDGALVGLSISSIAITAILGAFLSFVGLLLMFAFVRANPRTIAWVSYLQAVIWLFVCFMYLFNGAFLLSLGIGITWAVLSVYIAYASKQDAANEF